MSSLINNAVELLSNIISKNTICKSHGINHMKTVLSNSQKAIESSTFDLTESNKINIQLASLLHDADDLKLFPLNKNYENARLIIQSLSSSIINENEVIKMISLVSASSNGDNIPDDIKDKLWMLIPRWCDRIEAIGYIGIVRCWDYTVTKKRSLWTEETLKAKSLEDLRENIAIHSRYINYKGISLSMIDHYYDKLLHIDVKTNIPFIDNEMQKRMKISEEFCLIFGKYGYIPQKIYDEAREISREFLD